MLMLSEGEDVERIKKEIQVPNGIVVIRNGECVVSTGKRDIPLEEYLEDCENKQFSCLDEMEFLMGHAVFSFEGFHNVGRKKNQKNKELEDKLILITRRMQVAKSVRELDILHQQASNLLDKMHVGTMDDYSMREVSEWIGHFDHNVKMYDGHYLHVHELPSGIEVSTAKRATNQGIIDPELIKIYVDTIYASRKQILSIEKQANNIRSQQAHNNTEQRQEKDSLQTTSISDKSEDEDSHVMSEEEYRERLTTLQAKFDDLVSRRDETQKKLNELEMKRFKMMTEVAGRDLYRTEAYEVPVYREHPNPVDGYISGYRTEYRYVNGTDEERAQYEEALKKIEDEIRKTKETLEVIQITLTETRQQLDAFLSPKRDDEIEPQTAQNSAERTASRSRSGFGGFFGRRKQKSELSEMLAEGEAEKTTEEVITRGY